MKLPRSSPGPLKAVEGNYYYARVFRQVNDRAHASRAQKVTLLPNSIFMCEDITQVGPKIFAVCRTHPHDVEFVIQISQHHLLPAGYEPIKSSLLLLAMQAEE